MGGGVASGLPGWFPGVAYGSAVPRRARGNRIALTIRLPYDLYREVAVRAKARNWSMSDYVAFCVARELSGKYRPANRPPGQAALNAARDLSWVEEPFEEAADG